MLEKELTSAGRGQPESCLLRRPSPALGRKQSHRCAELSGDDPWIGFQADPTPASSEVLATRHRSKRDRTTLTASWRLEPPTHCKQSARPPLLSQSRGSGSTRPRPHGACEVCFRSDRKDWPGRGSSRRVESPTFPLGRHDAGVDHHLGEMRCSACGAGLWTKGKRERGASVTLPGWL